MLAPARTLTSRLTVVFVVAHLVAAGSRPLLGQTWVSQIRSTRSVVLAEHGIVASSQPLASQTGLEILKQGGNAVDAAIAMAAMLNVTEPMMTGIGGDAFMLVYWSKTKELKGLNASGRAPRALSLDHFAKRGITAMPSYGMETITVPGAFDGWVSLLNKYGTMKLPALLGPAIEYAERGFPVMEKIARDWQAFGIPRLTQTPAAAATYLRDGRAPRTGEIFRQPNLARTLRLLAREGRDCFYRGEIARRIVEYCQMNGGFLTQEDMAAQRSEWVDPVSTIYRGYTVYECPPNGQGMTALLILNLLEGFDMASLASERARYYHTLIEATKLAYADRTRYIADPRFSQIPVPQLLSKEYASTRRALIDPGRAIASPTPGVVLNSGETTYFTVVDKDRNAVSFINSLAAAFGSGIVAGDTGILLQNRGSAFSLDPKHPNHLEPGKRPFHTIIPAMVMKDGNLFLSFGVMGGDMQPQGHAQVLVNLIDLKMGLQQALDAPRFFYRGGNNVMMEDEMTEPVIRQLLERGHHRSRPPDGVALGALMGGSQAIMIDPATKTLMGASDPRKDGLALGY